MLTHGVKAKLIAFVVLGLLATTYLGARYVGINPFGSGYDVAVSLPDGGGAFANGEVTYRGVPVGRIEKLHTTKGGAEAVIHIDAGSPDIPADVKVAVANRSPIGEQYINLIGASTTGPMLADGDHIRGSAESLPPAIDQLLRTARDFSESVPSDSLTTVIDESYEASRGLSTQLQQLLETSEDFVDSADKNFLVTSALIESADTVLATQQESAASIKGYSADLNLIADTLSDSDADLRKLIDNTPAATRAIGRLFDQVGTPLGILMSNLVSTADVFGTYSHGVEDALIHAPEAFSIGWAINGSKGINLGLAQTYFDPLPCTSGYGGTTVRPGLDTTQGDPFNTKAGCSLAASSGVNVRGPGSVSAKKLVAAEVSVPSSMADLLGGTP